MLGTDDVSLTRREAIVRLATGALAAASLACGDDGASPTGGDGRIAARPGTPTGSVTTGLQPLGLASGRDGLLYVPTTYDPEVAAPLAVLLHGAGRRANEITDSMRALADPLGLVLVAPDSRGTTWDAIRGTYGADVDFIDEALASTFAKVRVDPSRVRVAGFSDGASYALSIGRINGDLFGRVAAFSPGFVINGSAHGQPRFFITHGTLDQVLPIDQTSRQIVPLLRQLGYAVEYHEFEGGHGITPELLQQATTWLSTA
jgi:phospholipase/carboxylesterase